MNLKSCRGNSGIEFVTAKRSAPRPVTLLRPGQELLICLGWLRLFQRIVAPELSAMPDRGFRRGR